MKPLEECLDMPLRDVLALMQKRILERSTYFGVKALKSPVDFWIYQEIITSRRPDVILEVGNNWAGSTLALAHLCDLMGCGRVIGLDIRHDRVPDQVKRHPRLTLITGDAVDSAPQVRALVEPEERVLVIEDSAHTYENTLAVLHTYADLVKTGDYFIVEDSICHHGLDVGPAPGPMEAIESFVATDDRFEIDRDQESFLVTWNPKGYLRRR